MGMCKDCKWWRGSGKGGAECVRHTPTPSQIADQYHRGVWPWTEPDEWCGEFDPRPATNPAPDAGRKEE